MLESILIKHIVLFEVGLSGHHPIYLDKIAKAFLNVGCTVTSVVSERYKDHPLLACLRKQFINNLNIVFLEEAKCEGAMKSKYGDVGREIALWRIFKNVFSAIDSLKKVDFVFLPYADYCLNAIGLLGTPFGKVAWGGICMRPTFHFKTCGVIAPTPAILYVKRFLFIRVLQIATLKTLFSIDELLTEYIHKKHSSLSNKVTYLPDPSDPPATFNVKELRQRYNIKNDAKVILVYGAINERKGLFELLDALELTPALSDWCVLVVGRQSASVREALLTSRWVGLVKSNRIYAIDDFVTNEVEHHVLAMCDVVWVAYVGHYTMSGIIVRAGMYRKPVIACEEGLIGWYAREKGVGVTIQKETKSIEVALNMIEAGNSLRSLGDAGYSLFIRNTWLKFEQTIISGVDL